jgi:hypothetical protein
MKFCLFRNPPDALHFWIGTGFQGRYWYNSKYKHILATPFNSGVSIIMFPMTQPQAGEFDFGGMDRDMSFAKDHGMKLFGAALVYRPSSGRIGSERCVGDGRKTRWTKYKGSDPHHRAPWWRRILWLGGR